MSEAFSIMYHELLGRRPSSQEYEWLNRFNLALPDALQNSPAFLAEVIIHIEHIRQLKELLDQAVSEAERRAAAGLDKKVKEAALAAVRLISDRLPNDAVNVLRRLGYFSIACVLTAAAIGFMSGWLFLVKVPDRQAAVAVREVQSREADVLANCVIEADEAARPARRRSTTRRDLADLRQRETVQLCAARYVAATSPPP